MARKKKDPIAGNQPTQNSLFDAMEAHAATLNPPDGGQGDPPAPKEPTVADLMKEIGALQARLEDQNRVNTAVLQPQTHTFTPAPPAEEPLPDPIQDPKGYERGLTERIERRMKAAEEAQHAQARSQAQSSQRFDALFDDFREAHPELAEHEDRVEFVTTRVVQAAKQRGWDLDQYMFGQTRRFFSDVAREYEKTFGRAEEDENDDPNQDTGRAGVFGGAVGGPKTTPAAKDQPGDMVKELQEIQRKMGLF